MTVKDKKLLVIGLGTTGTSVIKKVGKIAGSITGLDDNPATETGDLTGRNLSIFLGKKARDKKLLEEVDLVIASPGIGNHHPVISWAREADIPVWSEIELAWNLLGRQERKKTIAVTGTNGKTTAVNLMGKILESNKMKSCVCGNVGYPLINTIGIRDVHRVIEVSSFQLEWVEEFAPQIGILLNISSDHIDRHKSIEEYARVKFKLFAKQKSSDFCILNFDDNMVSSMASASAVRSQVIGYGSKKVFNLFFHESRIFYRIGDRRGHIDTSSMKLGGAHNISNAMACIAAAKLLGIGDRVIEKTLKEFEPLEHRLEYAGTYRGVACYNDSKSTNPHAAIAALKNFNKPLTLVLGGKDKGMELDGLLKVLEQKVSALILIGESREKISKALEGRDHNFEIHVCGNLEEAVEKGLEITGRGGTFLLSPAFASMDMFKDYKDRGNQFKSVLRKKGHGN